VKADRPSGASRRVRAQDTVRRKGRPSNKRAHGFGEHRVSDCGKSAVERPHQNSQAPARSRSRPWSSLTSRQA